jgi:transcriptional regulator with XRE-family HTH domain
VSSDEANKAEETAFYEDFGQRVRQARGELSQRALGERVGLSRGSISNIEAGRQHVPLHLLPKLARALGVDASDLLASVGLAHDVDMTGLAPDERHFVSSVIARARNPSDHGSA